jgi:predicted amidophosphoribosyltransferase
MELPLKARKKNIRGAFEVRQAFAMRHVAVVDDVVTTGSTVNELARILRQVGVQRIQIWSCARTV